MRRIRQDSDQLLFASPSDSTIHCRRQVGRWICRPFYRQPIVPAAQSVADPEKRLNGEKQRRSDIRHAGRPS
jgi:hypothetical protein